MGVYAGYYPAGNQALIVFRGTDYVVNWIQVIRRKKKKNKALIVFRGTDYVVNWIQVIRRKK